MTPHRVTNMTAACTVVLAYLAWQVATQGWLWHFDQSAIQFARALDVDRRLFELTVMFGLRGLILSLSLPVLVWISWTRRSWIPVGGFLVVLAFETGIVGALKMAMERPFPYRGKLLLESPLLAFPSGHAANSVALWGYLAWFFTRGAPHKRAAARRFVMLAAATTGVSSWLIRTHWPTDLLAGFAIGGIALTAGIALIEAIERTQINRGASALR
jgi:membrane-associated phospholipid phosphatase